MLKVDDLQIKTIAVEIRDHEGNNPKPGRAILFTHPECKELGIALTDGHHSVCYQSTNPDPAWPIGGVLPFLTFHDLDAPLQAIADLRQHKKFAVWMSYNSHVIPGTADGKEFLYTCWTLGRHLNSCKLYNEMDMAAIETAVQTAMGMTGNAVKSKTHH